MALRVERDPAWWQGIADHPEVWPYISRGLALDVAGIVSRADVLPLASENGGYWLHQLDVSGTVFELHAVFRPEGWGREAFKALGELCESLFERASVIVVHEVESDLRSRPAKTFGFKAAGDFAESPIGPLRTWILTKTDWQASPARRSMRCLLH